MEEVHSVEMSVLMSSFANSVSPIKISASEPAMSFSSGPLEFHTHKQELKRKVLKVAGKVY